MENTQNVNDEGRKIEEKIMIIKRISKKTTGGNYITFSVLAAVGDGQGMVGVGVGRSQEIPPAIKKAISYAKKHMIKVAMYKSTIPHDITIKYKSSKILLKPAPEGSGLKVGNTIRAILELAGIKNASGKILKSKNRTVNIYAVLEALKKLKSVVKR